MTGPGEWFWLVGDRLRDLPPLEKQELIEGLIVRIAPVRKDVTAADIRKASVLLYKAQMFELIDDTQHNSRLLKLKSELDHMKEVDMAFMRRLRSACTENNIAFEPAIFRDLLFTKPAMPDLSTMLRAVELEEVA